MLLEVHGSGMQGFFLEQNQDMVLRGKKNVCGCQYNRCLLLDFCGKQCSSAIQPSQSESHWLVCRQRPGSDSLFSSSSVALPGSKAGRGEAGGEARMDRLVQSPHLRC